MIKINNVYYNKLMMKINNFILVLLLDLYICYDNEKLIYNNSCVLMNKYNTKTVNETVNMYIVFDV